MHKDSEFYFHEDDQYGIEIISKENEFIAKWQFTELDVNKIRNPFKEMDSDLVHQRARNLLTSTGQIISIRDLDQIFSRVGLGKIGLVLSGYSSHREACNNVQAFGTSKEAFLIDVEGENVERIWLSSNIVSDESIRLQFVESLIEISKKWDLVLIHWNQELAVDLKNTKELIDLFVVRK